MWKPMFENRTLICSLTSKERISMLGWVDRLPLDRVLEFGVRPLLFWSEFHALTLTMD